MSQDDLSSDFMTTDTRSNRSVIVKASDFGLFGDGNDGGAFEAAGNFAQLQRSVEDLCKDGGQVGGGVGECVKCRSEWLLGINLAFSNRQ